MVEETIAVAVAVFRCWRNDLRRTFDGSAAPPRVLAAVVVAAAAGWWILGLSTLRTALPPLDPATVRLATDRLLLAAFMSAVALAGLLTVVTLSITPPRTALGDLLAVQPLSRGRRRLALEAPGHVLAIGAALALSGPAVVMTLRLGRWPWPVVPRIVLGLVLFALLGSLACAVLYQAGVLLLARMLRLPLPLARSVVALLLVVAIGQQVLVLFKVELPAAAVVGRGVVALSLPLVGTPAHALLALGGLLVLVGIAGSLLWALLDVRPASTAPALKVAVGLPPLGIQRLVRVDLEARQWIRFPYNASVSGLLLGTAAAAALFSGRHSGAWPTELTLLLLLTAEVGVGGYGATWAHHWLYRSSPGSPSAWVAPKLAATTGWWALMVAGVSGLAALLANWQSGVLLSVLPQMAVVFVAGSLAGLLFPVSQEQSLSSVAAAGVAALGAGALLWGMGRSGLGSGPPAAIAAVVVVLAGTAAYRLGGRARERDLVA